MRVPVAMRTTRTISRMLSSASARVLLLLVTLCTLALSSVRSTTSFASTDATSARLHLRVRDGSGRPLVARARIVPKALGERVRRGQWRGAQAIISEGGSEIRLSPGEYRVVVTHGPEWSIRELELTAYEGDVLREDVVLWHEVSLTGFHAADLHVHTPH